MRVPIVARREAARHGHPAVGSCLLEGTWEGGRRTASVAPSERDIETAVHVITVLDIARTHVARFSLVKRHVMLSAERFQDGIEAFTGPLQDLTQAVDADPMGALRDTVRGGPELLSQGGSVDQSGFVFLRIEPLAQRLAHDGIA